MNIHKLLKPFLSHFRKKRMRDFENEFKIKKTDTILDVGGTTFNWSFMNIVPKVTFLNLYKPKDTNSNSQFEFVIGDATKLDYADNSFDIVYSGKP